MNKPKNFNPEPYAYHQEVTIRIESLTHLGLGLGRENGWVIMVPFSLPGELVRARIYRNRSNFSEADLLKVLEESPDRTDPACTLFGRCGGCQYQHFSYNGQLQWKKAQVEDAMQRIGGIETVVEFPISSPNTYNYRSKITPHYHKWRENEDFPIGFLQFGQRSRIVDVPTCPIATTAINEELPALREETRRTPPKRKSKGATLLLRDVMEGVISNPQELVTERVGDRIFQFKAGEFFQNNPFILPQFVNYVGDHAAADGQRYLVDTYCGSGLFALTAADRFEKVIGIEVSAAAVTLADSNTALNRIENATFRAGEAERIFSEVTDLPPTETTVVIDPPRKGCDPDFLRQLIQFSPSKLVYVSCDPTTQARDLKVLVEGGFEIKHIQPFDLFPQTRHIENVAVLAKRIPS